MKGPARAVPVNSTTLQTVYDWMADNSLGVVDKTLVNQRRRGMWESLYVLIIGPVY